MTTTTPTPITIPEAPPAPTEEQAQALQLKYQELALVIANDGKNRAELHHIEHLALLKEMEAAHQHRHQAAMKAADRRHADNQAQADIKALRLALAVSLGGSKTPDQIRQIADDLWPMIGLAGDGPSAPLRPALPAITTQAEFAALRGFGGFYAFQGAPSADYLLSLHATGATHARCWYSASWDGTQYVVPQAQRDVMQSAIAQAAEIGLYMIICIEIPRKDMPWGQSNKLDAYVALVQDLAAAHAGQPALAAWDMLNEPDVADRDDAVPLRDDQVQAVVSGWRQLASRCVDAIRVADPGKLCVYQIGHGGQPSQFAAGLPLDRPGVIHSAHVYQPHTFTHQNVSDMVAGREPSTPWAGYSAADKGALAANLQTLAEWAKRHGQIVYIGETSAIRYAPGAVDYVRDVLTFCDAQGWPWSYHDWRGWPGWDAEQVGNFGEPVQRSDTAPMLTMLRDLLSLDPRWYLSQLGDEFARYQQPRTLAFALEHWQKWGRPQGRKGRPDGPGWGPRHPAVI